ncbi:MAG: phage holin family protein [Candidatus Dasytiphilus stammeri]
MKEESRPIYCHKDGIISITGRIIRTLIEIIKTRISLMITELDEAKTCIWQIFRLIVVTLLLVTFFLNSLLLVAILLVNPKDRLVIMITITGILFILAFSSGVWTLYKIKKLNIFSSTCKVLKNDSNFFLNKNQE